MKNLWMNMILKRLSLCVLVLGQLAAGALRGELLPRDPFDPDPAQLKYLDRVQALLQSGRPDNRATVRVLFYGQSFTQSEWWRYLSAELTRTYPNVDFVITNKAVAGFQALALSYASVADVGPWQPDLIFLHALGRGYVDIERLYARIRRYCTADVIAQSDHPTLTKDLVESEDQFPRTEWYERNYIELPVLANRYEHCWGDQRTPWKAYVNKHGISLYDLLIEDKAHFNEDGNRLQTELMMQFVRPREISPAVDPFNTPRIQTRSVGSQIHYTDTGLDLKVKGNRVDVIFESSEADNSPSYTFTIDGAAPETFQDLWGFDRVSPTYSWKWPGIMEIGRDAPLIEETWTMVAESVNGQTSEVVFNLRGSKTGADGQGSSLFAFRSNSGRVVIQPGQITLGHELGVSHQPPPANYEVSWNASKRFVEVFKPVKQVGKESVLTLFLSSVDQERTLKITTVGGGSPTGIKAIRAYSPSGQASVADRVPFQGPHVKKLTFQRNGDVNTLVWPLSWGVGKLEFRASLGSGDWAVVSGQPVGDTLGYKLKHSSDGSGGFYRWTAQ